LYIRRFLRALSFCAVSFLLLLKSCRTVVYDSTFICHIIAVRHTIFSNWSVTGLCFTYNPSLCKHDDIGSQRDRNWLCIHYNLQLFFILLTESYSSFVHGTSQFVVLLAGRSIYNRKSFDILRRCRLCID